MVAAPVVEDSVVSEYAVDARELTKVYTMGEIEVHALRGVSVQVKPEEILAIIGPSGSGKSTMMSILGALDRPTSGEYYLDGENVAHMSDEQLADVRNRKVGFIFQRFNLLPRSSALSNVQLPLRYLRDSDGKADRERLAREALISVGLGDRLYHRPSELSGGQQQRVAVARAIVNNPAIVMADEPTGNLDTKSGDEVMELLSNLNKERGTTIVIITHDMEIAEKTQRVVKIRDGMIEQ